MSPTAMDSAVPTHSPDEALAARAASPGLPPDIIAQRLIAVPWRHAGLIAVCALAGGLASTMFRLQPVPAHDGVRSPVQAIQDAPPQSPAAMALRLDLEPGAPVRGSGSTQAAAAAPASAAALQLDDARDLDALYALLRQAAPAAGHLPRAPADERSRPNATLPGLVAGLLLGLLAAALRELRGERMRSPREAEWALGAPVLGAIPTLSARARDALLEPAPRPPEAA